jgi:hypothetical protein
MNDSLVVTVLRAHDETGGAEGTQADDGADDAFGRHGYRAQTDIASKRRESSRCGRLRSIRRSVQKTLSDGKTRERAE